MSLRIVRARQQGRIHRFFRIARHTGFCLPLSPEGSIMKIVVWIWICLLIVVPVAAQEPATRPPEAVPPASAAAWSGSLGVMVISSARYEGANQQRLLLLPTGTAELKRRIVFGSVAGGVGGGVNAYLWRTKAWTWTGGVGLGDGRSESRADALAGMGDRRLGFTAGTGVAYRHGSVQASAGLAKHLNAAAGWTGSLTVGVQRRFGRWLSGVGTGLTLADSNQMQYEFGIDPAQAARRSALVLAGDPRLRSTDVGPYSARGGIRNASINGTFGYALSLRLALVSLVSLSLLAGDAANSPLVLQPFRVTTAVGLQYRWPSKVRP
jgi:outer membrane scaffolding protein for murein synthesis (MipA/OmpV family)